MPFLHVAMTAETIETVVLLIELTPYNLSPPPKAA